jgi:hypothetical protein
MRDSQKNTKKFLTISPNNYSSNFATVNHLTLEFNNRIGLLFFGVFLLLVLIFSGSSGNSSFAKIKKMKKQFAQKELAYHNCSLPDERDCMGLEEVEEDEESFEVDEIIEYEISSAFFEKHEVINGKVDCIFVSGKFVFALYPLIKNFKDSPAMPPELS